VLPDRREKKRRGEKDVEPPAGKIAYREDHRLGKFFFLHCRTRKGKGGKKEGKERKPCTQVLTAKRAGPLEQSSFLYALGGGGGKGNADLGDHIGPAPNLRRPFKKKEKRKRKKVGGVGKTSARKGGKVQNHTSTRSVYMKKRRGKKTVHLRAGIPKEERTAAFPPPFSSLSEGARKGRKERKKRKRRRATQQHEDEE